MVLTKQQIKAVHAKNQIRQNLDKLKIGDVVTVYVSPDEKRRKIKITKILKRYKEDGDTGGIEGHTSDGNIAWARTSQIIKFNPSLNYKKLEKGYSS